jgi:hypothetical protein
MSEIEDGGGAFPHGDPTHGGDLGMTLRDYFAAAALQGLIFHNSFGEVSDENIAKGSDLPKPNQFLRNNFSAPQHH